MLSRYITRQRSKHVLLLTRSYADIINEIRAKSPTESPSPSPSQQQQQQPRVNRFAQQYAQSEQQSSHKSSSGQQNRPRNRSSLSNSHDDSRNSKNYEYQKNATPRSGFNRTQYEPNDRSQQSQFNNGHFRSNNQGNNGQPRRDKAPFQSRDNHQQRHTPGFGHQLKQIVPQLTKEEIEQQKTLKFQELQKEIARQDAAKDNNRDTQQIKSPMFQKKIINSKKMQRNNNNNNKKKKKKKALVKIQLPPFISVSNLATVMQVPLNDVFKKLEGLGFEDIRHSYILDKENAAMIADEYDLEVETVKESKNLDLFPAPVKQELLKERPPVVTIMGHVDHGKTTILDYLRKSSIVKGEFGGITQHIGAFSVIAPQSNKKITFLDTPGHAAFLKMRERGAIITDIVILVVAADDSVMPQTIEAIKHAKKAGVPMIVAINKCDKPGINVDKVLADLSAQGVDVEDYGGETQTVQVSGKTGLNMDKLEEAIVTLSELNEFKAETKDVPAEGWIIESEVLKGMGNVATVLVRRGSLKTGDIIVAGETFCKIRGMKDEYNKVIKIAGPSTPVQVWGWKNLPDSGDQILQASTEHVAKKVIDYRVARSQEIQVSRDIEDINVKNAEAIKEAERLDKIAEMKKAGLDPSELEKAVEENGIKKCEYIIKADVFGSAEAIKESIDGLGNDEVKASVLSHSAGPPTESDIELAKTFGATIFCFNIQVPKTIHLKAEREKVEIKEHNIIYRLIEDVTEKLSTLLTPRIETKILAEVEVKDVFTISQGKSKMKVAGCKVSTGIIKRSSQVKVLRDGTQVFKGNLSSLKHVKEDIAEARKGGECGITFSDWNKFEQGDIIQAFEDVEHKQYL